MARARECFDSGFYRIECRLDQRPFTPAAFDPLLGESDIRVVSKAVPNLLIRVFGGTRIEMDGNIIAHSGQLLCLMDNGVRVFVAQKDEGDFSHIGND